MSDNTKGVGQTDAPADGPCENPSASLGHASDITLYGVTFPADEVGVHYIDGAPQWTLSMAGARRAAQFAPDPVIRREFLALLDRIEAGYRG